MIEYRQFKNIRNSDSRSVNGVAAVFETQSEDLGFIEIIHRGAITQETINKSDIFATLNHDTNKILARSKYGKGSLLLELDDNGLNYHFEAPNTDLGDELLEYLNRGDIDSSSFAFSIDLKDKSAQRFELIGNKEYRHIYKIDRLYDVSPVFCPAYTSTSVAQRNKPSDYEEIKKLYYMENRNDEKEAQELQALKDELEALKVKNIQLQEEINNSKKEELEDKSKDELEDVEKQTQVESETTNEKEETPSNDNDGENEEKEEKNNRSYKNMEKQFSIVKEIRSAIENGTNKVELRAATVDGYTPAGEGAAKVDGLHDDVVATETMSILEPLYADSVLTKIGATWYKDMPAGDIKVPVMSKGTVNWEGEIAEAGESKNVVTHITLKPKRLTAYVDISKKLIYQDTAGVEEAIKRDIVRAVQDKFENTVLGDAAGNASKPAGIFYNETGTTVTDYKGVCDLEATVEEKNATGNMVYLLSPKTKAFFKQLAKSSKNTQLVLEGNELDGVPAISTSNVPAKKFIYGNFQDLCIGVWDGIELTIDPYTQATKGCIRIIVNAYMDAQIARKDGLGYGKIS